MKIIKLGIEQENASPTLWWKDKTFVCGKCKIEVVGEESDAPKIIETDTSSYRAARFASCPTEGCIGYPSLTELTVSDLGASILKAPVIPNIV